MVEPLLGVGEVGHFFLKGGMLCFLAGKEGGLMLVICISRLCCLFGKRGLAFWRFTKP